MIRLPRLACLLLLACATARAESIVELLDPGTAPRQPIRYQFVAGSTEHATMSMMMSMSRQQNGEVVQLVVMPATRMTVELRVTDVAADGSATVQFDTRSVEASIEKAGGPAEQAAMANTLAGASRLSGTYRMDTRGRTIDGSASLRPSSGSPAPTPTMDMALAMANEATPDSAMFPQEAVGAGARWRVTAKQQVGPVETSMVQEYTLRSRSGDKLELDTTMKGTTAAPGAAMPPGMQAGSEQTGKGTLSVDLRRLANKTNLEMSSDLPTPPGQPADGSMRMTMSMSVTPQAE